MHIKKKATTWISSSCFGNLSGYCDSNTGPSGPKPDALTNCATPRLLFPSHLGLQIYDSFLKLQNFFIKISLFGLQTPSPRYFSERLAQSPRCANIWFTAFYTFLLQSIRSRRNTQSLDNQQVTQHAKQNSLQTEAWRESITNDQPIRG